MWLRRRFCLDSLLRLIGWGSAKQMLLFGENIDAEEALRWGLVGKGEELNDAVDVMLRQSEKNGPLAVRRQKALIRRWENLSTDDAVRAGNAAFGEAFE